MKKVFIALLAALLLSIPAFADSSTYLNFTAVNGSGSVQLNQQGTPNSVSLQYSTNNGTTWSSYSIGQTIQLSSGSKVYFKATSTNNNFSQDFSNYYYFNMTGTISADGNIMSLLDASMQRSSVPGYAFLALFYGCPITSAPSLPATTLSESCYSYMFSYCTLLTSAPALPATNLADYCYVGIFEGCTSLTTPPTLPATNLTSHCYNDMFWNCTSLSSAPSLPATNLAEGCYCGMFYGCSSLTTPPALPATTLEDYCYRAMFDHCTSLTSAPTLPATTMKRECYILMFDSCTSLTSAPALPATTLAKCCYAYMFCDCPSLKNAPALPATTLADSCYYGMFGYCSSLVVNSTLPGVEWKIPSGATSATDWNAYMLYGTGGTYTNDPVIGQSYYISSDPSAPFSFVVSYDYNQSYNYRYHGTLSDGVSEVYFYNSGNNWYVTKIATTASSITIPDTLYYNGTAYQINYFGYSSSYSIDVSNATNMTEIHLPATITNCNGYLPNQITELYITSPQVVSFYNYFFSYKNSNLNIYVPANLYSTYFSNFQSSSYFSDVADYLVNPNPPSTTVTFTVTYDDDNDYYYGTLSDSVSVVSFYRNGSNWYVTGLTTTASSITIPDSLKYRNNVYAINYFGYSSYNISVSSNLTEIHLPATITNCNSYLPSQITELHIISTQVVSFYNYFFYDMNSALEIYVPESQYSLYYTGFSNSSYLYDAASHLTYERTVHNVYTITVNTPGTMAQQYFQVATQWGDVDELTVIGSIDSTDMKYFNKMTNLSKLDLRQTSITQIAGCAGLNRLRTVLLPTTVTSVADSAFYNCTKLDSLLIPDSIVAFGAYAFYNCYKLRCLPIQNIESIGSCAIYNCNVTYSSNNSNGVVLRLPKLTTMQYHAFVGVIFDTLYLPNLTYIPNSGFSIDRYANHYTKIRHLYTSATSMGTNAFYDNYYLLSVDMPNMKSVSHGAFEYCSNLTSVNLPSATSMNGYAFYGCYSLSSVNVPSVTTTTNSDFGYCPSLTYLNLPSIQYIYEGAFENSYIDTLILGAELKEIEYLEYEENFTGAPLSHVFCYAPIPPKAPCFNSSRSGTLHVPTFALNSYRMDDNWSHFANIVPIDTLCDKLIVNEDYTLSTTFGLVAKPDVELVDGNLTTNTSSNVTLKNFNVSSIYSPQYVQYYNNSYYYNDDDFTQPTLITLDTVTADTITEVMYMSQNEWNFVTFPFDVNVADIVVPDSTYWVIRRYSGQDRANLTGNSWQNVTSGMTLNANEGYIIHCMNSTSDYNYNALPFTFKAVQNANKNRLFSNGNITVPLNKYASAKAVNSNWNLVGNPYPCYFNSSSIQHSGIITVWNGNGYTAYSLVDDSYTLLPGEALFVQCPANASSMTFLASGRTSTYTEPTISYAPANSLFAEDNTRKVYNLTLAFDSLTDNTRFVINESASTDYELSCDASKFTGSNTTAPEFYMVENEEHLAINERPMASGIFNLGFKAKVAGEYTIALNSNPDQTTYPILTDTYTGIKTNLANGAYTFNSAIGAFDGRFHITFEEVPAGIDNVDTNTDFVTEGDVYSMDGRFVMHFDNREELVNLSFGTYVLRSGNVTEKFIKK